MKYVTLGRTGIKVSQICLGTMNFGSKDKPIEEEAAAIAVVLDAFVANGGNFIDTADVYHGGRSEEVVGLWLEKQARSSVVIATKVFFGGPGPNDGGLSKIHLMDGVAKSLARLRTTYIDVYQIHAWDAQTPPDEWLRTMLELVQAGKIRTVGVSNVTGWQLQKIVMIARDLGVPLASLQTQYNLLCREPEFELINCALEEDVGVMCWSPLKGGWLTGKFKKDEAPAADSRVGLVEAGKVTKLQSNPSYSQFASNPRVWDLLDVMKKVATERSCTVPQVAVRWLLQRSAVTSVVIGPKNVEQLEDLMKADGVELTTGNMTMLSDVSAPTVPYPYEMVWRVSARGVDRVDSGCATPLFPTKKI
eukprot:m.418601 g.418601  ORF g.418601 m.418601 type:complete len:362 (-) comp31034_c0_seq1:118-1203(-)